MKCMKKMEKKVASKVQTKKDRLDESLGMRNGKESTKKQTMKDRRDESKAMTKKKKM